MPSALAGLKEFRLLWASGLFASLGAQMSALALPLVVLRQTGSPVQAGVVGTVSLGALMLTMLPGGALADSIERRRLMRLCNVGSLLVVSALAVAVLNGRAPLALVLLVAGASAVINSICLPAALGLLRAIVPADLLGAASTRLQSRSAAARLVGPLVGGAIFGWHPAAPFLAEAVLLALATICLALMRTRSTPVSGVERAFSRAQLGAGVTFLWRQPYLRTVLVVFGVGVNAAFSAMMFAGLAIGSAGGHSGLGGGTVVTLAAAGTLAGSLVSPRLRPDQRSGLVIAATCWTCAVAALALTSLHQPLVMGLIVAACTAVAAPANIGFLTALLVATPEEMVGRVQSAAAFLSSLAQPLGPIAAGALLAATGAGVTFVVLGCVFALCAAVVTWAPSVRQATPATVQPKPKPVRSGVAVVADR